MIGSNESLGVSAVKVLSRLGVVAGVGVAGGDNFACLPSAGGDLVCAYRRFLFGDVDVRERLLLSFLAGWYGKDGTKGCVDCASETDPVAGAVGGIEAGRPGEKGAGE